MKILIVEDDYDKKKYVTGYLYEILGNETIIVEKESLRSGLMELILDQDFDFIILDMSLPNFDISEEEPGGGTPESFAGKEFMEQMNLREIFCPVIILTQYSSFERGRVSLEELRTEFETNYGNFYFGTVYYNALTDTWKNELAEMIRTRSFK